MLSAHLFFSAAWYNERAKYHHSISGGIQMKKRFCVFLCLFLMTALCCVMASAETPVDPANVRLEDFTGNYICKTISFGKNIVPLQDGPYTLAINGDEAVINGIPELGTEPLKLLLEDDGLVFIPPEEEVRVFTLRFENADLLLLKFDAIPEAPVFRFEPEAGK